MGKPTSKRQEKCAHGYSINIAQSNAPRKAHRLHTAHVHPRGERMSSPEEVDSRQKKWDLGSGCVVWGPCKTPFLDKDTRVTLPMSVSIDRREHYVTRRAHDVMTLRRTVPWHGVQSDSGPAPGAPVAAITCTGALQANQFSVRGLECVPAVPAHAQAPTPSTLSPTKRAGTPTKRYFWLCRHTSLRQICRHTVPAQDTPSRG